MHMKIEVRPATEAERLNIDPEDQVVPKGVEVVDFGDEPAFCLPPGDHVLVLEGVGKYGYLVSLGRPDGTYCLQAFESSGFVKRNE